MGHNCEQPPQADAGTWVLLVGAAVILAAIAIFRLIPVRQPVGTEIYLKWQPPAGFGLSTEPGRCMPEGAPAHLAPVCFKKIPINRAEPLLLQTISGIGPVMASAIVATRARSGPFKGPEDLLAVSGIGPKRMKKWQDLLDFD